MYVYTICVILFQYFTWMGIINDRMLTLPAVIVALIHSGFHPENFPKGGSGCGTYVIPKFHTLIILLYSVHETL